MSRFSHFQHRRDALALSSLTFVALLVFWPLLWDGRACFFGDLELYFYAPTSFRLGVFVSLCALSFVVAVLSAKTGSGCLRGDGLGARASCPH